MVLFFWCPLPLFFNCTNGNQGFDGVFIKRNAGGDIENVLVNETKQVSNRGIQLNPRSGNLPQQMSDDWITHVLDRMLDQSGDIRDLAVIIDSNRSKITKVVTGIDKANDTIKILKLN